MTSKNLKTIGGTASLFLGIALVIGLWSDAKTTAAVGKIPVTLEAVYKTNQVLDRAIEVYGGKKFLDSINSVEIVYSGTSFATSRSWNPKQGHRELPILVEIAFQKKEGNYRYGGNYEEREFSSMITSANSNWANIINNEEVHLLFPLLKMATRGFALPGIQDAAEAMVPHLIVAKLAVERRKVIWLGEEVFEGKAYDLIAYPEGITGYNVFAFDKETGALAALQRASSGGASGDRVSQIRLGGYYGADGTIYPKTRTVYTGNEVAATYVFDKLDLNAELDISRFSPPADFQVFDNLPNRTMEALPVADNAYWVPVAGSGTLFVEFDDYVVVLNTAGDAADLIPLIQETVGNKPIRYAVVMDHHGQQISGVRSFVKEGIPLITTSGNRDYIEALATIHSALNQDALALDPQAPIIEIVDEKRVFDDGKTRLEIINIGPLKHAEDLYVGYLPDEKIIFAADFFNFNPGALPIAIPKEYMGLARESYAALARAGIEAETLVLAHGWGWRTISIKDIERIISRASGS